MNKFKKSDYYMSENHIKNFENTRFLGRKKLQELKNERIDNYNTNPKLCANCQKPLEYKKKNNKFCCKSCAAIFNNKNRSNDFITDEFKEKQRNNAIKIFNNNKKEKNEISYYEIEIKCPECGTQLTNKQKMRKQKFCSNLCSKLNITNVTIKKMSDSAKNRKNKKTIEMICVICEKKFTTVNKGIHNNKNKTRKTCSDECNHILKSRNSTETMKKLIKNGTHKGWQSRNIESYPEKFFKKVLDNNNIKYEFNKKISKRCLGLDCDHSYFLDFYLIDKNIDLEIDGKQHIERKKSDEIRDNALIKNGFVVYRIKWKNINTEKGKNYIKNEINNFLIFYNL